MAVIVQTNKSTVKIRVALIIEAGKIRPVWFEDLNNPVRDRVFIKEICSIWNHMEGAVKIISFSVWDGANNYCLSLDTKAFTWQLGITEETPFPSASASSTWRFRQDLITGLMQSGASFLGLFTCGDTGYISILSAGYGL